MFRTRFILETYSVETDRRCGLQCEIPAMGEMFLIAGISYSWLLMYSRVAASLGKTCEGFPMTIESDGTSWFT